MFTLGRDASVTHTLLLGNDAMAKSLKHVNFRNLQWQVVAKKFYWIWINFRQLVVLQM